MPEISTGHRIPNNQEIDDMKLITQSTEIERQAEEAERNRQRLRTYYTVKAVAARIQGKSYRVPRHHLPLFYRFSQGVKS